MYISFHFIIIQYCSFVPAFVRDERNLPKIVLGEIRSVSTTENIESDGFRTKWSGKVRYA